MLSTINIIARAGSLRHSLSVLLTALGAGGQVTQYDTIDSALSDPGGEPPVLIVLDAGCLGDDPSAELTRLVDRWPHARLLTLADDDEQSRALRATTGGLVVTSGVAAARLRVLLADLLAG